MFPTLRVARPTDRLADIARMYESGLGLQVLARFQDHDGFDGVILGLPGGPCHLEFTSHRSQPAGPAPGPENLLVLYIPDAREWSSRCDAMQAAGFTPVPSTNPYWDAHGRTYLDLDGCRVVLARSAWDK